MLSGCFLFSKGPSSRTGDTPDELKKTRPVVPAAWDFFPYGDPADARPGDWARYRIAEKGGTQEITIGVGGKSGDRFWIEVVEEADVRKASARLVAPDGAVSKAFYREVPRNGTAGPVHPQELKPYAEPTGPVLTERSRTSEPRDVKVGERTIPALAVRVAYEDLSGRRTEEERIWSAEVPKLFEGGEAGGLVRKKTPQQEIELLDFGTGYRPVVDIPK